FFIFEGLESRSVLFLWWYGKSYDVAPGVPASSAIADWQEPIVVIYHLKLWSPLQCLWLLNRRTRISFSRHGAFSSDVPGPISPVPDCSTREKGQMQYKNQ